MESTYPTPASVLAIAEWGGRQSEHMLADRGFPEPCTPCQSTLQRLFCRLDAAALFAALRACFALPLDLLDQRDTSTIDQGHGRTAETRTLIATTDLVGHLDWPGQAQVFRVSSTGLRSPGFGGHLDAWR